MDLEGGESVVKEEKVWAGYDRLASKEKGGGRSPGVNRD